ncbi:hypothetical protein, partial [Pseudomonas savastanoi]|uniref:hypothetical protein n=1 Tax=Pseudomonas savastanoi TaxID=29438 RepID=UPI001C812513
GPERSEGNARQGGAMIKPGMPQVDRAFSSPIARSGSNYSTCLIVAPAAAEQVEPPMSLK